MKPGAPSSEPFSEEKLRRSLRAAGGSEELVEKVAREAYPVLCAHAREGLITSLAIKEEVAFLLGAKDAALGKAYQEYRKPLGERK